MSLSPHPCAAESLDQNNNSQAGQLELTTTLPVDTRADTQTQTHAQTQTHKHTPAMADETHSYICNGRRLDAVHGA